MPKKTLKSAQTVQRIGTVVTGATELYAEGLIAMQQSISAGVLEMVGAGMSREAILIELQAMDFVALMEGLGYPQLVDELIGSYETILSSMTMFGNISESMLTSLVALERSSYVAMGSGMSGLWQQEIARGVINGLSEQQLNQALLNRMSNFNHVRTEINTAMNTFSRTVTYEQARTASPKQMFRYEGPQDMKTRPICVEMGAAGDLTLEQAEEEYPGGFIDGGGYNCRHQWVQVQSAEPSKQEDARQIREEKQKIGRWEQPLTVREQLAL